MNTGNRPSGREPGNTGQGVRRGRITDEQIRQTLAESHQKSSRGFVNLALGLLLVLVGIYIASWDEMMIFGIILMVIAMRPISKGGTAISEARSAVKNELSQSLIPDALSRVLENVEYDPAGHISSSVIHATHLFFPFHFTDIEGSDLVKASYKGVNFEVSDIILTEITQRTTTNSDGDTETETVEHRHFKGQWLICDFHKTLSADLCVFESSPRLRPKDLVRMENEAFNEKFGVSCSSPHDAFYVLTPHMIEYIMDLEKRAGGKLYLRFLREGKVHVVVNSGRDQFEIRDMKKETPEQLRQKFQQEVEYITGLIDTFLTEYAGPSAAI